MAHIAFTAVGTTARIAAPLVKVGDVVRTGMAKRRVERNDLVWQRLPTILALCEVRIAFADSDQPMSFLPTDYLEIWP